MLDRIEQGNVPHDDLVRKKEFPWEDLEGVCAYEGKGCRGDGFYGSLAFVLIVGEEWEEGP